ncbi:hypothetical protein SAMN04488693_1051 [Arthrobacter subterraneus]|uniref:Uncharacterized protein n=1 Tax=Arthrobacter subterraneus TaxID=335973 RepID=A0A1G8GYS7_9MICC|nr:hypothetical protein [Arthrobacter subterraneus]SDH99566.1 hypothetical protein SAMN04488693_1051 [Arthrobacter subterraneus]
MTSDEAWIIVERAGLMVGFVGLAIAIWQIIKTRGAVETAKTTIEESVSGLRAGSLLLLTQQLGACEAELVQAMRASNGSLFVKLCSQWKSEASQLRGLLSSDETIESDYLRDIQHSIGCAGTVGIHYAETPETESFELQDQAHAVLLAVDKVTGEFGFIAQRALERSVGNV